MKHGMGGTGCPVCGEMEHGQHMGGFGMGHGHHMGGFGMKGMGGMRAMFMMVPWQIMMHSEELGLSEDQMNAFRDKHAEVQKKMIQLRSQVKMNMIDIRNAVMREEIDMQTAEAKAREVGTLKGDMVVAMIQGMQDMRQILSPGQRRKVRDMIMSMFKKGAMPGMQMEEDGEEDQDEEQEE